MEHKKEKPIRKQSEVEIFPSDIFPEDVFPEDIFPSDIFPRQKSKRDSENSRS